MTTDERIETNANKLLWCVHVAGPDDVYAEPTHAAAVASAAKLNKAIWSRPSVPEDVLCFAYADIWPWTSEQHAASMVEQSKKEAERTAARAAAKTGETK
jgi:hypothetical protein